MMMLSPIAESPLKEMAAERDEEPEEEEEEEDDEERLRILTADSLMRRRVAGVPFGRFEMMPVSRGL
jgi:hypothetical protein